MLNKNIKIILDVLSVLLLLIQTVMFFYSGLLQMDFKILVLSLSPQFAYQHVIEFPVWISSLFIRNGMVDPDTVLNVLKSLLLISNVYLIYAGLRGLTRSEPLSLFITVILQLIFLLNQVGFQFLLFLLFFIVSLYFFMRAAMVDSVDLNSKRFLILSTLFFGTTFLIHPVSFLLFVPMFGSLPFSRSFSKKGITYLSLMILLIFLSPKIMWEIQNLAKPDCPQFIYVNTKDEVKLSDHVIIDDRFQQWDKLYYQRNNEAKYSLLSSFENQIIFRWDNPVNTYDYMTFMFSDKTGLISVVVKNGYSEKKLNQSGDEKLFFSINSGKSDWMRPVSYFLFWLGQWGIFIVVPVLLYFTESDKKRFASDMKYYLVLVLVGAVVIAAIKSGVDRPRPLKVYAEMVNVWFTPVIHGSFPSGDAQAVFTMITPLFWLRRRWFYILLPVACLTALNRVVTGAHFPFDVFIGSMVGVATAGILKLWLWDNQKSVLHP